MSPCVVIVVPTSVPSVPLADGAYRQVNNLYQASSIDDKIFEVVYTDDYSAKIVFGDGSNGVSPPSLAPYLVTYRVGGGSRGNIPASYIVFTCYWGIRCRDKRSC